MSKTKEQLLNEVHGGKTVEQHLEQYCSFKIEEAIHQGQVVSGKEIAFNLNQVIKELESIDQDTIDANSNYITSVDYVENLINRLYDVYFERQKYL